MRTLAVALALLTLGLPLPVGASPSLAVAVTGPDEDGAYVLSYEVTRAEAGPAALALDVRRDDAGETATGSRDLGTRALGAGASRLDLAFVPAEGPGRYEVRLAVDGERGEALAFDVADAAAARRIAFDVPDEPTYLNLTNDTVNAAGKTKSPGEEIITRATLADRNGMGDIDALLYVVRREGASVEVGALAVPGAPENVTASLEHRFARSPLAAGDYALSLHARRDGVELATVERTFTIRDVAPTLAGGTLPPVVPDANATQRAALLVHDRNGPPPPLEARVYRGSTRVETSGFAATLGAPTLLEPANGTGRTSFDLDLATPARAAAGAYRVSLYAGTTLVGTIPFEVLPLPALLDVRATGDARALVVAANVSGDALLRLRVQAASGASTSVTKLAPAGSHEVRAEAPDRSSTLAWTLELRAREGGPVLATREGVWSRDLAELRPVVVALRAPPRTPAIWRVDAPGWDLAGATAEVTLVRWDGAPAAGLVGRYANGTVRVETPPDVVPGRYTARLSLRLPNGTAGEAEWTFDAGPSLRVALGEPAVDGREARIVVRNDGGVPIRRLVVDGHGAASATLEVDGIERTPRSGPSGRLAFVALDLAPGAEATLVLRLPPGPLRAGAHAMDVRVLALAGGT